MKSESSRRMRFLFFLLLVLAAPGGLHAENEGEAVKPAPRQMRLLTVGEAPPFRQEIRDGVRIQLPAPPGSLPPAELDVLIPSADGKEKESGSLNLRIGSLSAPVTVPGGAGSLVLRLPKTGPDSDPWYRLERPETGDFIVVMWRGRTLNTWDKPSGLVLPADFPVGRVSLINVAPVAIALVYNDERFALSPMRPLMRPLKPGKPLGLRVGLPKGNSLQQLVSRSLEQSPGQHSIVVFYRADGEKPRSPLGIEVIRLAAKADE